MFGRKKRQREIEERCRKALATSNLEEIHEVALLYDTGSGVPQDRKYAFDLFLYAARLGYARSQNAVAICYENGEGVEKSMPYAIQWYKEAAKNGHDRAMAVLGTMYALGEYGIPKDLAKGLNWIARAGKMGNVTAINFLNQINVGYREYKSYYKKLNLYSTDVCTIFFELTNDAINGDSEALKDLYYLEKIQKY